MSRKAKPREISVLAERYAAPPSEPIDLDKPEGLEVIKHYFENQSRNWLPSYLARIREESREVLTAAGLPDDPDAILVMEDGTERVIVGEAKRKALADLAKKPRKVSLYRVLANITQRKGHEIGSKIWYAAKVLDQIACFDRAKERGDRDTIAHEAFHLGALVKQADVDVALGRELNTGVKTHRRATATLKKANTKRSASAAADHQRWIAEANKIWRQNPGLSADRCANAVKKRLGLDFSQDTIRKRIAGHKPQKVGKAG